VGAAILGARGWAAWQVGPCSAPTTAPVLRFVDVGQGSSLLVDGGGEDIFVVDSGPSRGAEALLAAFEATGIREVGLWLHTHFDADHVGGVTRVLAGVDGIPGTRDDITVGTAWDRGVDALPPTEVVAAYFASPIASRRVAPAVGTIWRGEDLEVRTLQVAADPPLAGENARGLAACVEVAGLRLLVLGDLPAAQAEAVAGTCADVDVLWVSHHGSADGISLELLEIASPSLAVISAGEDNPYCHPTPLATALLADVPTLVTGVAATDPAATCGDLAVRWQPAHRWLGGDVCVWATAPGPRPR
jgi:competence protein ComEC